MDAIETVVGALTGIAALTAVVVAVLTFRTYMQARPSEELKRQQDAYFVRVSANVIMMLECLIQFEVAATRNVAPHPYLFSGYRQQARQLYETLAESATVGATLEVAGMHEHKWPRQNAFSSALWEQTQLEFDFGDSEEYAIGKWSEQIFKAHLLNGLIELMHICLQRSQRHKNTAQLRDELQRVLKLSYSCLNQRLKVAKEVTGDLWR